MNKFLWLWCFLFVSGFSFADAEDLAKKNRRKEIQETIKVADGLYKMGRHFDVARDFYKKVVISDPNNMHAIYRLAETYRFLKYYQDAQKWYKKIVQMDTDSYPKAKFYYAQMSQAVGDYRLAMGLYYQYMDDIEDLEDKEFYYMDKARIGASACSFALEQTKKFNHKDSIPISLSRLSKGINKERSEFGFTEFEGSYLYTGTERIYHKRKIKYPKEQIDAPIKMHYDTISVNRIYQTKSFQNKYQVGKLFGLNLETEFCHIGSPSFSLDSTKMYVTLGRVDGRKGAFFHIYRSTRDKEGNWSALEKIKGKINHKRFSSKNPHVVQFEEDEAILFSSNQPGGYGKFDLYYATIDEKGKANNIVNLGESINTIDDEITPFYKSSSKKLFFSSNGHIGFGEHDVYQIFGSIEEGWGKPRNLGLPYNSSADDIYYSQYGKDEKEFISSNRDKDNSIDNSTCCYDIYRPSKDTVDEWDRNKYIVHLNIFDKLKRGELTSSNISIVDTKTNNLIESVTSVPGTKLFVHLEGESEFIIRIENSGFEPKELRVETSGKNPEDTIRNNVYMRTSLNNEEKAFEEILRKFPDATYPDLVFRVQIGAYSKSQESRFDKMNLQLPIEEMVQNRLFKYVTGLCKKGRQVEQIVQKVVTAGVPDAFPVAYYKGERIFMNEAKYLLSGTAGDE